MPKFAVAFNEEGDDSIILRQVEARNEGIAALRVDKVRELLKEDALQNGIEEEKLDEHIDSYDLEEIKDKLGNTGVHMLEVLLLT